eukprot:1158216-Pelagomonas_calceolata.AAC.2
MLVMLRPPQALNCRLRRPQALRCRPTWPPCTACCTCCLGKNRRPEHDAPHLSHHAQLVARAAWEGIGGQSAKHLTLATMHNLLRVLPGKESEVRSLLSPRARTPSSAVYAMRSAERTTCAAHHVCVCVQRCMLGYAIARESRCAHIYKAGGKECALMLQLVQDLSHI